MAQGAEKVKCPNCGYEFDVSEILYHQLEEKLKKAFNAERVKERNALKEKESSLQERLDQVEEKEKSLQQRIDSDVKERLKEETDKLRKEAQAEAEEAQAERIEAMREELKEKSEQVKELNKSRAEIERLKRDMSEQKDKIEAENQQKFTETLRVERERIKKETRDQTELKLKEKDTLIEQLNTQLQDAQRKAEQGSMQMQGEAQELVIEEWLRTAYPLDTVEEIKKGAQGADCLQIVNTRSRANCGSIYYESKRTKSFQPAWIEKFKNDIREKKADIGVLVTEAMPQDMDRMGMRDGVWICSLEEFKGLSAVFRENVIRISSLASTQVNKGTKKEMLYDFVTGPEFRMQVEAIVEGFTQMQTDLLSEKRAIQAQWKKREKQIEKVLLSTSGMYSSVRGIAGNSVQPVKMLEFETGEDGDDETLY